MTIENFILFRGELIAPEQKIASLALAMTMDNVVLFPGELIAPEQKIASLRSQ